MVIFVTFFAATEQNRFENKAIHLPEMSDMATLLRELELEASEVGILVVNGKNGTFKQELHENDFVTIIPPLMGG